MHAELADQRIERHHFGSVFGRNGDAFARGQDIELVRVQNDVARFGRLDRVPEFERVEHAAFVDVDDVGVMLGAPADMRNVAVALEIDRQAEAAFDIGVAIDQRRFAMQAAELGIGELRITAGTRNWFNRDPLRTSTGKVRGEISA